MKAEVKIGDIFGRLKVYDFILAGKWKVPRCACICECGKKVIIEWHSLKRGHVKSCGCLKHDGPKKQWTKHGYAQYKNRRKEYLSYHGMLTRCYNKNNPYYYNYGGRDIKVCDRWLDKKHGFENFLEDMGNMPEGKTTLERLDLNRNYCPENCVWATRMEQNRNTSRNKWLTYNNTRMILADWGRLLKINVSLINRKLKRGQTFASIVEYYASKKNICLEGI